MKLFNKKRSPTFWFDFVWALPQVGTGIVTVILSYVTYYATNVLGLEPALVGTLLLSAKIFDGFTDIVAGFLIDKTNTKWGRGRPYDLAYVFFALSTLLLFSGPRLAAAGTAVFLLLTYILIFSVFQTLYMCANAVYLARAVENTDDRVKVVSVSGLIITLFSMIFSIAMPQLIDWAGGSIERWRIIAAAICIPCAVLGIIRMFIIKETNVTEQQQNTTIKLKEGAKLLFKNKYVLIFGLALLSTNIATNLTQANVYYFQYIVEDIKSMSLYSVGSVVGPFALIIIPVLSKKIGLTKIMQLALFIGVIGKLIPMANNNMTVLLLSSVATGMAYIPIYMYTNNALIDCMDYGEWKTGVRGEGIYTCVSGFCSKIGTGLASWVIGITTALGGFSGTAKVQTASANMSINLLFTLIPAVLYFIAFFVLTFYKLDKKIPEIKQELAEIRNK